jgi:hypothetical protein
MNITRKPAKTALPFDPDTVEVEVTEATGYDMEKAFMAAGTNPSELRITTATLAQVATFDGKKLTMEELLSLPVQVISDLGNALAASPMSEATAEL